MGVFGWYSWNLCFLTLVQRITRQILFFSCLSIILSLSTNLYYSSKLYITLTWEGRNESQELGSKKGRAGFRNNYDDDDDDDDDYDDDDDTLLELMLV